MSLRDFFNDRTYYEIERSKNSFEYGKGTAHYKLDGDSVIVTNTAEDGTVMQGRIEELSKDAHVQFLPSFNVSPYLAAEIFAVVSTAVDQRPNYHVKKIGYTSDGVYRMRVEGNNGEWWALSTDPNDKMPSEFLQ